MLITLPQPLNELFDGLGLVTGRFEVGGKFEFRHVAFIWSQHQQKLKLTFNVDKYKNSFTIRQFAQSHYTT